MKDHNTKWRLFKCVKVVVLSVLSILLVIFLVAAVRTFTLDINAGLQLAQWEKTNNISSEISKQQREDLLNNFKEAIQIPTVSFSETDQNTTALQEFNELLERVFPTIYSSSLVKHEVVANYSHLFTVPGTDPRLVPYMLLAHIDVVPANEADGWEVPPFSAQELNGFIYGRGTIDNKQSVMGILQGLEYLLERGYVPRRGFFIGLGHDEEVNGYTGAVNIVKLLKSRGVKLQFVLDEGLAVLDGIISGLEGPAALIGVSEKGHATVKLSVDTKPGHSSMPPKQTSIGILAAAVTKLEENPMPRLFGYGPERGTFEHLAHKFADDTTMAGLISKNNESAYREEVQQIMNWCRTNNLSLNVDKTTEMVVDFRVLERTPVMNAMVRTTTAVTIFNSGVKVNVLPSHAEALVNLRIHSAQRLQEVMDLIESTISDSRVKVELVRGFDPLPVSSYDEQAFGYQVVKRTVLAMFPQVTVAPGICIGNTDSRHYTGLTNHIYLFNPTWFKPGDTQRFHGINERISCQNYEELVRFYFQLIQNCDIRNLPLSHSDHHEF